jgi:hypothetical protein
MLDRSLCYVEWLVDQLKVKIISWLKSKPEESGLNSRASVVSLIDVR